MESLQRMDGPHARPLVLIVAGILLFAGCSSIPGDPDDPQIPSCLEHAAFGDPKASPYVLPYPVGRAYEVFQTYCGPVSHGRDGQMSIDFLMPMGSEVVAARGGIVHRVVDRSKDFGSSFNYIYIKHGDGTVAFYAHLQQNGARVRVGERVVAGQLIALSGSSGTSLPHLHFGVASSWPPRHPDDVPVNFRNTTDSLDARRGLVRGVAYLALPDTSR